MKRKKKNNIYVKGSGGMKRKRIIFMQKVVGRRKDKGGENVEKV